MGRMKDRLAALATKLDEALDPTPAPKPANKITGPPPTYDLSLISEVSKAINFELTPSERIGVDDLESALARIAELEGTVSPEERGVRWFVQQQNAIIDVLVTGKGELPPRIRSLDSMRDDAKAVNRATQEAKAKVWKLSRERCGAIVMRWIGETEKYIATKLQGVDLGGLSRFVSDSPAATLAGKIRDQIGFVRRRLERPGSPKSLLAGIANL
jgi:hypothetical protein